MAERDAGKADVGHSHSCWKNRPSGHSKLPAPGPTELPRSAQPSGVKNGNKLLRLKINRQGHPQHSQQHAEAAPSMGAAVGTSSSSSSGSQQPASWLYSAQLWQSTGYNMQRQVVSRDAYFPEVSMPVPVFKQLPPVDMESGQQKRAKLVNGQYRPRTAVAGQHQSPAEAWRLPAAHHKQQQQQQQNRHITPGLAAAAAAAAAERLYMPVAGLVAPSSSSSQDGAGGSSQQQSNSSTPLALQLRELPVAWPLRVSIKGRRSSRQRRSSWAQWSAVLHPDSAASASVAGTGAAGGSGVKAMDVEEDQAQLQQLPELEHQQSGVLQDSTQLLHQHEQQHRAQASPPQQQVVLQPLPLPSLQDNVQHQKQQQQQALLHIKQQQQREAAALLQQMAPATPAHAKDSRIAFAVVAAVTAQAGSKQLVAEQAAAAADVSPSQLETSTSSEQTHDGMQDSPRDPSRHPLSSWPSSSTDSVSELQQGRAHGKRDGEHKAAAPAAASGWVAPSSPLPARAL